MLLHCDPRGNNLAASPHPAEMLRRFAPDKKQVIRDDSHNVRFPGERPGSTSRRHERQGDGSWLFAGKAGSMGCHSERSAASRSGTPNDATSLWFVGVIR